MRIFYDLRDNGPISITPNMELRNRFSKFVNGEMPRAIVVNANSIGRINFTDGLWISIGMENGMRPYFIIFQDEPETWQRLISIYRFDKGLKEYGRPVELVKHLYVKGSKRRPVLLEEEGFKPRLLEGEERLIVQRRAYKLGYITKPKRETGGAILQEAVPGIERTQDLAEAQV